MRRCLLCVISALVPLVAAGSDPASPASADATDAIAICEIDAWSTDTDPEGLAVRAGPGTDSPVIARLPPPLKVGDEAFAAEVSITGSTDGWFRIDNAILINYIDDEPAKVVFEGESWVSGRYLGLSLNDRYLHRGPADGAPVVATLSRELPDGQYAGPDSFLVDRLHACQGHWVEVEGTYPGTRLRGWATRTCANQVTTCP